MIPARESLTALDRAAVVIEVAATGCITIREATTALGDVIGWPPSGGIAKMIELVEDATKTLRYARGLDDRTMTYADLIAPELAPVGVDHDVARDDSIVELRAHLERLLDQLVDLLDPDEKLRAAAAERRS